MAENLTEIAKQMNEEAQHQIKDAGKHFPAPSIETQPISKEVPIGINPTVLPDVNQGAAERLDTKQNDTLRTKADMLGIRQKLEKIYKKITGERQTIVDHSNFAEHEKLNLNNVSKTEKDK